ncbi:hypothetical protein NFJ02_33g84530 [Pycnococcus provasolii]
MTESEVRKYATDTERKIAQHAHAMGVMQRAGHLAKHRESTEDLQLLMAWLMPGITKYQVGRIGSALEDVHNKTAELEVVVTPEADVQSLVDLIRFDKLRWVLEPSVGTGSISRVLRKAGVHVLTNDANPMHDAELHLDSTQLKFWERLQQDGGVPCVVCSCWFRLLDLMAPLAVHYAQELVCLHISPSYVTTATLARQKWLRELADADRVALVTGLSTGALGRRCSWLLISRKAGRWREFLKQDAPSTVAWIPLPVSSPD